MNMDAISHLLTIAESAAVQIEQAVANKTDAESADELGERVTIALNLLDDIEGLLERGVGSEHTVTLPSEEDVSLLFGT